MAVVAKPVRPGTVVTIVGQSQPRALPSLADTVALVITHSGGPVNVPREVTSMEEFDAIYGAIPGVGRDAVLSALDGGGLPDARGAGTVIVNRMAGSAVATATRLLTNTTPATAITITGDYPGTRYNNVTVSDAVDPNVAGNHIFTVKYQGLVVGSYSYPQTALDQLVAQINTSDQYINAALNINGIALTAVSDVALTGGNDGTTLVAGDYTAALTALQWSRFAVLSFMDLTDGPTQTAVLAWVNSMAAAGRPALVVFGGALNETLTTAIARSVSLASYYVVNLGVGSVHDDLLSRDLSTAQLAPRVAGIITARADRQSLTFAKMGSIHILVGPAVDTYDTAINNGVTTLSRAISADADTKVEKGVTTFISSVDVVHPRQVFGDPRLVQILNLFTRRIKEWGDENIIGDVPVNDDSRAAVRGFALAEIASLERRGLIIPGTGHVEVEDTTNTAGMEDSIPFTFGWQFAQTANHVFAQGLIK